MTHLYSCKSETHPDGDNYRITKFDSDMNVESSYQIALDGSWCACPAGERPSCRHREMLPKFVARGAINSFWFYDYDRSGWVSSQLEQTTFIYTNDDPQFAARRYNYMKTIDIPSEPHSVAASTGDFDSPSTGSNPVGVANKPSETDHIDWDELAEIRLEQRPNPNRRGL